MKKNTKQIKYFLYARSKETGGNSLSIKYQINTMTNIAKDNKLEIVETFTEIGSAGNSKNRPIFNDMLTKIKNGEANGILCSSFDRLYRNNTDYKKIQLLLEQYIIKSIITIGTELTMI